MTGKVYGIGIGPGDPELITLKALRLLQSAQVLAYPAPQTGDSLARSIIEPHLPGNQIEIAIRMPMVAARFPAQDVYDQAVDTLSNCLNDNKDVAVLCEGDPFFYGSFMYLFGRLVERFTVEVIPGVSSLTACATMLGAPLAARNDVLTILPAPIDNAILQQQLNHTDAAAIIKVGRHFERIYQLLRDLDLHKQSYYIEHATMQTQRILPLHDVDTGQAPYFSMILVHKRGTAWAL